MSDISVLWLTDDEMAELREADEGFPDDYPVPAYRPAGQVGAVPVQDWRELYTLKNPA